MKQLYTVSATVGLIGAVAAALHPTFIPEGGYLQALAPVLLAFISGTFGVLATQ